MAEYSLYGFGESGNSYKAALMLNLCELDWAPVLVDYFNGETRSAAFRADINDMGEVPVLIHGAHKITQSGVILDYLATMTGKFGGKNAVERREVLRWLLFDNHKFTSPIATLRFMITLAKTGETPVTEFLRARVNGAMQIMDAHLARNAYLTGDRVTIADLSAVGYLYFGDELPFEILPHVQAWMEKIRALPHWKHPYDLLPRLKAGA